MTISISNALILCPFSGRSKHSQQILFHTTQRKYHDTQEYLLPQYLDPHDCGGRRDREELNPPAALRALLYDLVRPCPPRGTQSVSSAVVTGGAHSSRFFLLFFFFLLFLLGGSFFSIGDR